MSDSRNEQTVGDWGPESVPRRDVGATQRCVLLRSVTMHAALDKSARRPRRRSFHSDTRSQWRLTRASMMWSQRRSLNMSRVAAFWTDWSRRMRYSRLVDQPTYRCRSPVGCKNSCEDRTGQVAQSTTNIFSIFHFQFEKIFSLNFRKICTLDISSNDREPFYFCFILTVGKVIASEETVLFLSTVWCVAWSTAEHVTHVCQ